MATNKVVDALRDKCDKKIFIYGAGGGGKFVHGIMKEKNIPIEGYIDKNWEKMQKSDGLDVIWLDAMNARDCIVIVSIMTYHKQIEDECSQYGFNDEENLYYLWKRIFLH